MTPSEYEQLVEFLRRQFSAIDRRFTATDRRFDGVEQTIAELRADMLGHFDEIYRRLDRLDRPRH